MQDEVTQYLEQFDLTPTPPNMTVVGYNYEYEVSGCRYLGYGCGINIGFGFRLFSANDVSLTLTCPTTVCCFAWELFRRVA